MYWVLLSADDEREYISCLPLSMDNGVKYMFWVLLSADNEREYMY